jgi:hypothetical protein
MTSSRYNVQVDKNIPVCDGPSYEDICTANSPTLLPTTQPTTLQTTTESKSMMIVWIVLPILFVLLVLVAASVYLYYRYRNHYVKVNHSSQYIIDDLRTSEDPESINHHARRNDQIINQTLERSDKYSENNYHAIRSYDEARRRIDGFDHNNNGTNEGIFYDGQINQGNSRDRQRNEGASRDRRRAHRRNGARNEGRHQRRDNVSQVLEPVVIGELVSTDNEILNLPTASVANIDEEDVLYVDLFVNV